MATAPDGTHIAGTLVDTSTLTRYGAWITEGRWTGFWACQCSPVSVEHIHHRVRFVCVTCGCLAPEAVT